MQLNDHEKKILEWMSEELQTLTGDENLKLNESTNLLDVPHLDSVVLITFIIAFEKKYNVKIPMDDLVKDQKLSFFLSLCS